MLRILTYHRIVPASRALGFDPRLISADPEVFEGQVRHLARHYCVVSMDQVLGYIAGKNTAPRGAVLLTFDDAYTDFAEYAWPVLKKYKLPACLFVPTGFPDQPGREFWWDRLYRAFVSTEKTDLPDSPLGPLPLGTAAQRKASLRRMQAFLKSCAHARAMAIVDEICARLQVDWPAANPVLGWGALRRLAAEGVALGAHTVNHPIMNRLMEDEIRFEIKESLNALRRESGAALPIFCYPAGGHDDAVRNILREEGIRAAFTTEDGLNDPVHCDPLRLRRTNITRRTTPLIFRLRLRPWFAEIDRLRHRRNNPAVHPPTPQPQATVRIETSP